MTKILDNETASQICKLGSDVDIALWTIIMFRAISKLFYLFLQGKILGLFEASPRIDVNDWLLVSRIL